jgi:thiamine-monophosphate kinase
MMDVSDGLARSLHQLADASDCGFAIEAGAVPVAPVVDSVATDPDDRRELSLFFGEDFELAFTVPEDSVDAVRDRSPVPVSAVGEVVDDGVTLDGTELPDRGYTHGE